MKIKKLIPKFLKNEYKHYVTDCYIVSYPKAGRTWLRFLLGYYLNEKHNLNLSLSEITTTRLFYKYNLPYINFSHFGNPHLIKKWNINKINFNMLRKKKVVFLYRDPRPQSVSNYYQFFHRGDYTKVTNEIPDNNIDEFILGDLGGINSIINYYNLMYVYSMNNNVFFLKYEDLLNNTNETMKSLLTYLNLSIDLDLLNETVVMADKKNLSYLESKKLLNAYHFGGTSDTNYKVRKDKKKWNEEIKPTTLNEVNKLVVKKMNPFFLKK